jgi:hypothetical protein
VLVCGSCTEQVQLGQSFVSSSGSTGTPLEGASASGGTSSALDASVTAPGFVPPPPPLLPIDASECVPAACGTQQLACGDCDDDDGDGRIDAADPECLGPCDNDEADLFTGLETNVNASCRSDCYFDTNAGYDDGCRWSYACDEHGVPPLYPPTGLAKCAYEPERDCEADLNGQTDGCREACLPLVPNGCDCFGCCELPAASGRFVWLGSEGIELADCEIDSADASRCRPCTPVPSCQNDCEECELCVGKPALPASCAPGADGLVRPACSPGLRACDPLRGLGCGELEYCITGCCVPLPR